MPRARSPPMLYFFSGLRFGKTFLAKQLSEEQKFEGVKLMPIMDSELNDAAVFTLIPGGVYNAHVVAKEDKKSKGNAPMAVLDWQLDGTEGDHASRKVRFDNIMLGGVSKDKGKPLSLGQLCSFLHYTGIPWSCKSCGTDYNELHAFLIATNSDKEAHGLKVGNFYCRECKNPNPSIIYDTDNFLNAHCGIRVGSQKKEGSDNEYNTVTAYTDLKEA